MIDNEDGMTLVEVLASLILITLASGIIWTTVSVATKFNVGETTSLKIQQEANYIISELQRVHRTCEEYSLTITQSEVSIKNCRPNSKKPESVIANETISNGYRYVAIIEKEINMENRNKPSRDMKEGKDFFEYNNYDVKSIKNNLEFNYFAVEDLKNDKRYVNIPTTISRYRSN